MVKETVKYLDGSEVEIDVMRLGFRKANQISKKHIPINDLSFGKDKEMTIRGDIDIIGMTETALETIKGLDLDKVTPDDANRIFTKYFKKDLMSSLGDTTSPN